MSREQVGVLYRLITTAEAATACGVASCTISMWASRGHLTRSGLDEHNHPLYKLGDVLLASRNTRQRAVGNSRIA
jgi:DNA-binding transcriptional MerR regulator